MRTFSASSGSPPTWSLCRCVATKKSRWSTPAVAHRRHHASRIAPLALAVAGVDQHRLAGRRDEQRGRAAFDVDEVDLERASGRRRGGTRAPPGRPPPAGASRRGEYTCAAFRRSLARLGEPRHRAEWAEWAEWAEQAVPASRPRLAPLERVRRLCLALPETRETLAWGHPVFKAGSQDLRGHRARQRAAPRWPSGSTRWTWTCC